MKFVPHDDYLLVLPVVKAERTAGGILIPDTSINRNVKTGKLIALGISFWDYLVDDTVYYQSAIREIELDGTKYELVHKDSVYGRLTEEKL